MKKKELINAIDTLAFAVNQLANIEPKNFDLHALNCRHVAKLCVKELCDNLDLSFSPDLETIERLKACYAVQGWPK